MNCTPLFSGVRDGSRGRMRGVYDPAHAPSGAASAAEEPNPRAPAWLLWGRQTSSARMPQEILCALKPQLLPKDAARLTAPMGKPEPRHPVQESLAMGSTRAMLGAAPAGPGASLLLVLDHPSHWSRIVPPAWHSHGTVLVQPTPDWAPRTSLTFISHPALAFVLSTRQCCFAKERHWFDKEHNN